MKCINTCDKDFSALIAKMKQAGVSIVYYGGLHTKPLIMRQDEGPGPERDDDVGDGIRLERTGLDCGDAVDGTLMTFAPDPRKTWRPGCQGPRREVPRRRFEPEAYTLYAYAALQ